MYNFNDYRPARRIPVRAADDARVRAIAPAADPVTPPPAPEPLAPETATDWQDVALRLQAEMANFRKRQERRADEAILAERERLLRDVLPILDNLERTLDAQPRGPECRTLVQGVELTRRELARRLENEGVTSVAAVGMPFTPELHEAVATVPDPARAGTVVEVIEPGYTLNDRLLRPARVVVAA